MQLLHWLPIRGLRENNYYPISRTSSEINPLVPSPNVKSVLSFVWTADECVDAASVRALMDMQGTVDVILGPACGSRKYFICCLNYTKNHNFSCNLRWHSSQLLRFSNNSMGSTLWCFSWEQLRLSHCDEYEYECKTVRLLTIIYFWIFLCLPVFRRAVTIVALLQKFGWKDISFLYTTDRNPLVGRCENVFNALSVSIIDESIIIFHVYRII